MSNTTINIRRNGGGTKAVLCLCLLLGGMSAPVLAQPQYDEGAPQPEFDPIAFRGPDPSDQFNEIFIDQKLNAQVPLGLEFRDEQGNAVKLGDYFGEKPVVLALVYYECPMLCNQIMNGMVAGFDASANSLNIGEDYTVLTVSIDPGETPELVRMKKDNYLGQLHREGGESGWHFLTGSAEASETLAQSVGFRYFYDAEIDQYAHASGIMILTPEGKVSSYYLGIEYLPRNLQLAIMDAADGKIGSLVDQLILLCYQYDPTRGHYGFYVINAVRLGGFATVAAIAAFWLLNFLRSRMRKASASGDGAGHALDNGYSGNH